MARVSVPQENWVKRKAKYLAIEGDTFPLGQLVEPLEDWTSPPMAPPLFISSPFNCLFPLIYCPSSHLYTVNPSSHTVNPSLVYCLTRHPPRIHHDALRDCPIILLSHFISIIANKYISQCRSVLLPCFSKLGTHVSTEKVRY